MNHSSQNWSNFLIKILEDPGAHYLWLRSLSYLEYIGYRKMVKTLGPEEMGKGTYHHLSDEIRHSYMLKNLAENIFDGRFQHVPFENKFIEIAEAYFQEIDQSVHDWIGGMNGGERPFLCYMMVSYLIEKRALEVYPSYYHQLNDPEAKLIIQKIIKDEREHLSYLEDKLAHLPETQAFKKSKVWDHEATHFGEFLQKFQDCLPSAIH